ncbi:hypothetical protein GLOTRDRAFT_129660, partial [Gloeophyllum trabeum ATCC 11539]
LTIENVLDEWRTGEREDIQFTAKLYQAKYDRHLYELERFHDKTKRYRIIPSIQTDLLNQACENARAPVMEPSDLGPGLMDDDLEQAIQDWLARRGGASDDDQGGDVRHEAGLEAVEDREQAVPDDEY